MVTKMTKSLGGPFLGKKGLLYFLAVLFLSIFSSMLHLVAHAATGTIFSPWMRKDGKRIRWAVILTRQAKPSREGLVLKAVRAASFLRGAVTSISSLFPRVTSLLPLAKRKEASSLLDSSSGTKKLAPRLLTREEALLLDAVISRPTSRLSLARIGSGYYPPRFRRAKLAMSFLVPTFSKAISKRLSLPMGVTDSTMPLPKTLWLTESPG